MRILAGALSCSSCSQGAFWHCLCTRPPPLHRFQISGRRRLRITAQCADHADAAGAGLGGGSGLFGGEDAADGGDGAACGGYPEGEVAQALRAPGHVFGGGGPDGAAGDVGGGEAAGAGQLPQAVAADAQGQAAGGQALALFGGEGG